MYMTNGLQAHLMTMHEPIYHAVNIPITLSNRQYHGYAQVYNHIHSISMFQSDVSVILKPLPMNVYGERLLLSTAHGGPEKPSLIGTEMAICSKLLGSDR